MSSNSTNSTKTLCPFGVVGAPHRLDAVDASLREPVFLLAFAAVKWLILASVVGLLAVVQSHTPDFLAYCEYTSAGRLEPIFTNALVYGWGFNAAFAVALWLMVRLANIALSSLWMVFIAQAFWNLGVLIGLVGILIGDQVPAQYLEMPRYATPLLLFAYALIGVWGVIAFAKRQRSNTYIAQNLVFAALFWFPWIYAAAQTMVVWAPAVGVVQAIVSGWYASALVNLWFIPLALAAAYYLIPRVLGTPVRHYYLTPVAFWLYAGIACWACGRYFWGAPVPAWTSTMTAVATVALVLPVVMFLISLFSTALSNMSDALNSPSLRFILTGLFFLALYSLGNAFMMFRGLGDMLQFTYYLKGLDILGIYGCASLVFFGVFYYILPRLLERQWLSSTMLKTHYWGVTAGVIVAAGSMMIAGFIQGTLLSNPENTLASTMQVVQPWLQGRSYGFLLILIGNLGFAINFQRMLFPIAQQREQEEPTRFAVVD